VTDGPIDLDRYRERREREREEAFVREIDELAAPIVEFFREWIEGEE
jgi:hypothetical protein